MRIDDQRARVLVVGGIHELAPERRIETRLVDAADAVTAVGNPVDVPVVLRDLLVRRRLGRKLRDRPEPEHAQQILRAGGRGHERGSAREEAAAGER